MSKAVAIVRKDEVLALLREGKRLSDIEPVLGVSHTAITNALSKDPEYKEAIVASFDRRLDMAEDRIESAPDNVAVSRARAYHEALKWRAGVECTKFRDKQDATGLQIQVVIAPNGVVQTPTIESVAVRLPDNGQ
jgi:hypothetical protein